MQYLTIPNLDKHQAYKDDRAVQWIKLYTSVLTDYDFNELPDNTKAHLMLLWAFAASQKGRIPNNPKWLMGKLGLKQTPDIKRLVKDGFLMYEENKKPVQEEIDCCTGDGVGTVPRVEKRREEDITREEESIPPKPPKGDSKDLAKAEWASSFDEFIEAYPSSKRNVGVARKSWAKLEPHRSKKLLNEIMLSLEKHKLWTQWTKDNGEYIPGAAVWLNQERWKNEVDAVIKPQSKPKTQAETEAERNNRMQDMYTRMENNDPLLPSDHDFITPEQFKDYEAERLGQVKGDV